MSRERYMRPEEAAELLGMTPDGVRKMLREGRLRGRKIGPSRGRWRVLVATMPKLIEGDELARQRLSTGKVVGLWHDHGRFYTLQHLSGSLVGVVDIPDVDDARACYDAAEKQLQQFPADTATPVPQDGKRRCSAPGCGAILSRFNDGTKCALHG